MTAKNVRHISFSRDNLIQVFSKPDVFTKNPALASHQTEINDCLAKYRADASAKGCGCRADPSLLFDCFENMLKTLESLRANKQDEVSKFVHYATNTQPRENEQIELSVYFRKTGEATDLHRYVFVS